jgi:hypothetical protein
MRPLIVATHKKKSKNVSIKIRKDKSRFHSDALPPFSNDRASRFVYQTALAY